LVLKLLDQYDVLLVQTKGVGYERIHANEARICE